MYIQLNATTNTHNEPTTNLLFLIARVMQQHRCAQKFGI
jgi:hypothetical protein